MCDCDGCKTTRFQAALLANVSFATLSRGQVMHILSVVLASIKHNFIEMGKEEEFGELLNDMIRVELEHICLDHPIEPKKFDASFDFRSHLKVNK